MPCCQSCGEGGVCDSANLMKFKISDLLYAGFGLVVDDMFFRAGQPSSSGRMIVAALAGYVGVKLALRVQSLHESMEKFTDPNYLLPFEIFYGALRFNSQPPYYAALVSLVGAFVASKLVSKKYALPPKDGNQFSDLRIGPDGRPGVHIPSGKFENARRGLRVNWP